METHEYYSRPRNVKINRVTELGAWLKKQATQNAAPSLPERSSTHEDPSGTGSRRSDNEGDYAGEDRDTKETDVDFKDGVGSQGGSYLESEESGDDTDDSLMDKKTKPIDKRWRSYHGDWSARKPTLSREEFDDYRVRAEEQMKRLRRDRDYLRKLYSVKCDDLRKEIEKREEQETLEASECESTGTKADRRRREQLLERSNDLKQKIRATKSKDGEEDIDVFADSPSKSVQDVTAVVRRTRELRITILLQRAAILATADRWIEMEKRALEALELVRMLKKPAIEAKCQFWYGIALYCQGDIDKAAESFEQSKACRAEKSTYWANAFHRAEYDEMNPDKWLQRCENLIAHKDIEESPISDGDKPYGDPAAFIREIEPNTTYLAPRSSVGIEDWMTRIMDPNSNSSSDGSGCGETDREKIEDAREELEGLETPIERATSQTLEEELAGCALDGDSSSSGETEQ